MLKAALVGTGVISRAHMPAWENFSDVELVCVCDIVPEQMEKYPNVKHYTSFDEMLDKETLDIVDICTPTTTHAALARKAMGRGINVICEKPISLDDEEIDELYETAEKNNVKFMIAQVVRFFDAYEILKDIAESRRFGRLLSGTMRRVGPVPTNNWMLDTSLSGGVTFDLHIHDVDFLVYAFGKPVAIEHFRARENDQDFINATYQYEDFSINTSAAWYAAPYPFHAEFVFQFEKAVVANENQELKVYTNEPLGEDEYKLGEKSGYEKELRYFVDCVKNDAPCDIVKPRELHTVFELLGKLG